jgi:hypothetical protein
MDQESKLDSGVLQAILLMKNSAIAILYLGKAFKEAHISRQAKMLSGVLQDVTLRVLEMSSTFVSLREQRILVQLVTSLLEAPVRF